MPVIPLGKVISDFTLIMMGSVRVKKVVKFIGTALRGIVDPQVVWVGVFYFQQLCRST